MAFGFLRVTMTMHGALQRWKARALSSVRFPLYCTNCIKRGYSLFHRLKLIDNYPVASFSSRIIFRALLIMGSWMLGEC